MFCQQASRRKGGNRKGSIGTTRGTETTVRYSILIPVRTGDRVTDVVFLCTARMRYRRRLRRARYPTGRSESSTPGEFIFLSIVWAIRTTGKCFVHRLDQQREAFEDKQRDATSSTVRFFFLLFERAMRMTVFMYICTDRRRPRREVPRTRGARQETSAASIGAGPRRRRGRGRAQTSAQTRGTLRQGGTHGGVVGGEEARDARRLRRRRRRPGEMTF